MSGIIFLTVLTIVGSGEIRGVVAGKPPTFHPVLAGFFVGLFLYVFALINAELAAKFCYLFIAFALIANGAPVVNALSKSSTTVSTAPTNTKVTKP